MAVDRYENIARTPGAPAAEAFAITPSDSVDLGAITSAIYVGGAGNVTLRPAQSLEDVTYVAVPAGSYLTVRAIRVMATGTTATNLVGEI